MGLRVGLDGNGTVNENSLSKTWRCFTKCLQMSVKSIELELFTAFTENAVMLEKLYPAIYVLTLHDLNITRSFVSSHCTCESQHTTMLLVLHV